MKKDIFCRILYIFILAAFILMMAMAFVGCRTVELTKTRTDIDSTAVQVTKVDSSSYNLIEALYKYGKATEKTYQPGRDTTIIMPSGEVQIIQLPGQLITERIIETGEESTRQEEAKIFSSTDSLLIEFIKAQTIKDKETSGVPFHIVIILLVAFGLTVAGLMYWKAKTKA